MKSYSISKLDPQKSKELYLKEIKDQYEKDNFLNTNSRYMFGKLSYQNYNGPIKDNDNLSVNTYSRLNKSRLPSIRTGLTPLKDKDEILDKNNIRKLFESFKLLKLPKYNKSSKDYGDIPINIYNSLLSQKKILDRKEFADNEVNYLSHKISKKAGREEKDLIMNTLSDELIKNECINTIEERKRKTLKRNKYEILGGIKVCDKIEWAVSLRRPNHFKGERSCLVNAGSDKVPFWIMVKERSQNKKELLAGSDDNAQMRFTKFKTKNKLFKGYETGFSNRPLETIVGLNIKGKSLYNEELNNALKIRRAKLNKIYTNKLKKAENCEDEILTCNYTHDRFLTESTVTTTYLNKMGKI
ncbi:MAG: hypothetical protein MJ252_19170 [archaeon]|nr:hypothetical protein [archaeon]